MTVEEVFIFIQTVVVADLHQRLVGVAVSEFSQTSPGQPIQGPPQNLMVQTPDVEADPAGASLGADDVDGLRGKRRTGSSVWRLEPCRTKFLSHGGGKRWGKNKTLQLCGVLFKKVPPWLQETEV